MQRLEVSGAVRPIYGSLGIKRLTYAEGPREIFEQISSYQFHKNPYNEIRVFQCGRTHIHEEANSRF